MEVASGDSVDRESAQTIAEVEAAGRAIVDYSFVPPPCPLDSASVLVPVGPLVPEPLDLFADYSAVTRDDCADAAGARAGRATAARVPPGYRQRRPWSVLCFALCRGTRTRFTRGLTDRDRDESSRLAIRAWVRTKPQTEVQ